MENMLSLIGRSSPLFDQDILNNSYELSEIVESSSFLIIGAAGSIGQAVSKEIFKRNAKLLHCVDLSENNLVELVRDIRSSYGYSTGEFRTYALDAGSIEFSHMLKAKGPYDFILNLSALKHVRNEEDEFTLMRMIKVNIFNTEQNILDAIKMNSKKYFCVSTDKAANPVNMMGASKRIMELFLSHYSSELNISTARFANVAFSDGSLLHGFNQRIQKRQPIAAPKDIRRYFIAPQESGELCLMSCIFGDNRDIFFPKLNESLHLTTFSDIAIKYLANLGYEPYLCSSEQEARDLIATKPDQGQWPCLFLDSDTTGEKDFEEFYTDNEILNMNRFNSIGVIKNEALFVPDLINEFEQTIENLKKNKSWTKDELVDLFYKVIPDFKYKATGKYLDSKM